MSVLSVLFSLNTSHPNHTSFQIAPYPACIFLPPVWILWLYSTILFCCCFFFCSPCCCYCSKSVPLILQSVLLGCAERYVFIKWNANWMNTISVSVGCFSIINRLPSTQYYIYIRFNYLLLRYFCSLNRIPFSFWGFCFFRHSFAVCRCFTLYGISSSHSSFAHPFRTIPASCQSIHFPFSHFRNKKNNNKNNRKVKFLFYLCDVFILIRLFFPFCSILLCNLLLPFEFFAVALHTILWIAVICTTAFIQLFCIFFQHFVFGICYAFIDEKDR